MEETGEEEPGEELGGGNGERGKGYERLRGRNGKVSLCSLLLRYARAGITGGLPGDYGTTKLAVEQP